LDKLKDKWLTYSIQVHVIDRIRQSMKTRIYSMYKYCQP